MERNAKVESRASMRKAIHFESLRILANPEKQYVKKCALKKLQKAQGLLARGLKTLSEALYRKHGGANLLMSQFISLRRLLLALRRLEPLDFRIGSKAWFLTTKSAEIKNSSALFISPMQLSTMRLPTAKLNI